MRNIITIVAIFISCQLSAQLPLAISFGSLQDSILGQRGLVDASGNILLANRIWTNGGQRPQISMFDSNYVEKWSFYINDQHLNASCIKECGNNQFVTSWVGGDKSVILKFDASGVVLWYKIFTSFETITALAVDNAGNIYFTGAYATYMPVGKLNSNGSLLWMKKISASNPNLFMGKDILLAKDGNLMAVGVITTNVIADLDNLGIVKMNTAGDLLWGKTYTCTSTDLHVRGMVQSLTSNNIMLVGHGGDYFNYNSQNALSILIDSGGTYINNKQLSQTFQDTYLAVDALPAGGYVVSGLSKPMSVCGGNSMFVRLNENNDTVRVRNYGNTLANGANFEDIHVQDKYGINAFGSGSVFKYWNVGYEAECLRFNDQLDLPCKEFNKIFTINSLSIVANNTSFDMTELEPTITDAFTKVSLDLAAADICKASPLSITDANSTLDKIEVFPNPGSDNIHIRFSGQLNSISIKTISGHHVMTLPCSRKSEIQFTARDLKSGLYILQVQDIEGKSAQKLLMIEH